MKTADIPARSVGPVRQGLPASPVPASTLTCFWERPGRILIRFILVPSWRSTLSQQGVPSMLHRVRAQTSALLLCLG